jgi:recombinational DNA repair protein (RecF pathway)
VLAYFQWRLLRNLGLLGQMDRCVGCDQPVGPSSRSAGFSSRIGGMLCHACRDQAPDRIAVEAETLQGLEILARAEAGRRSQLPDPIAGKLNRLLAHHVTEQIGKPLKTARYVLGPGR